jgi:hypothetical protein
MFWFDGLVKSRRDWTKQDPVPRGVEQVDCLMRNSVDGKRATCVQMERVTKVELVDLNGSEKKGHLRWLVDGRKGQGREEEMR